MKNNENWGCFSKGFAAGEKPFTTKHDNPYQKGTSQSAQWKDGFYTAKRLKKKS